MLCPIKRYETSQSWRVVVRVHDERTDAAVKCRVETRNASGSAAHYGAYRSSSISGTGSSNIGLRIPDTWGWGHLNLSCSVPGCKGDCGYQIFSNGSGIVGYRVYE
jgi:hypothetical protein